MGFFRSVGQLIRLMQLPPEKRRLVVYSESRNYWPYLGGMVQKLATEYDQPLCYISSDAQDPGLHLSLPNVTPIETDLGFARNWLFENLDARVMLMTMPSLHQFQVKRSRHDVHYVYCQHSLVSLHMVYQEGAFDHYDTLFCAGPHHVAEARALEQLYQLAPKQLVEHGYAPVDKLLAARSPTPLPESAEKHILIAPSWGSNGLVETGEAAVLIRWLLAHGHRVTLRPHPQTLRLAAEAIATLQQEFSTHPRYGMEQHIASQDSLHQAHLMVSDWSGAAMDFAFGLGKPVIFVDIPRKIHNPHYERLGMTPFEEHIRHTIGHVIPPPSQMEADGDMDSRMAAALSCRIPPDITAEHVYHPGDSDAIGAAYIHRLLA